MRARALSFAAPRRVEVVEVDLPEVREGEVLVRTLRSGISGGTELLAYRGEIDPGLPLDETIGAMAGTFRFPFRYGYSCVGLTEPGGSLVFAFHPHQDRFVVPARATVAVGDVDPRRATLFPLVETALQVSLDAGQVAEEDVAVLGLGAVGLLTALLLRRAGARVLTADPRPDRRAMAAGLGLTAMAPEDLPRGLALVVEASGHPGALAGALALLAHEGTALVASWYGTKDVALPLGADFHRRRLTLRSTQVSTVPAGLSHRWTVERRRDVARRLLSELPLGPLATHEFPFARAADAFATLDRGEPGVAHVALCYE